LDWGINPNLFNQFCAWFGVAPAIDLFASISPHVVDKYLSRYYTPECAGVHALKLDWSQIVSPHDVAWIFPPTKAGSQVVSLIQQFKVDALLCVPALVGSNELIQIRSLKEARVSAPFEVPRSADSCTVSCRVPAQTLNPAFLGLKVFRIQW
jgi:hypothetical protein